MKKIFEEGLPWVLSLFVAALYFFYYPQWINVGELIDKFPDIGTFTFGFLLTLFGLIHQGSSTVIENFKKQRDLYKRFVHLNRNAVYVSLALTLYAYMVKNIINLNNSESVIDKVIVVVFAGGLVYFMITSIYFLIVFYRLVEIDS